MLITSNHFIDIYIEQLQLWSFKVDVVKVLLAGDIDLDLRDSGDKTVLDIMEDIKTSVSVEITDVIIG